jgi:hypothetical protein
MSRRFGSSRFGSPRFGSSRSGSRPDARDLAERISQDGQEGISRSGEVAGRGQLSMPDGCRVPGEHWMAWSIPLMTICGTSVRLHIALLVWGVAELVVAAGRQGVGLLPGLAAMYAILGALLARECLRAVVLRIAERPAESTNRMVVLWPGAAAVHPMVAQRQWAARHSSVRAAVVGIASGGVLVGMMAVVLLASGGTWEMLGFSLFRPAASMEQFGIGHGWLMWAWWLYAASVMVFAVNLLPLRPMDGGELAHRMVRARWRIVPPLLWIGVVMAGLIGLGLMTDSARLVGLAAWAGGWSILRSSRGGRGDQGLGCVQKEPEEGAMGPTMEPTMELAMGPTRGNGDAIEPLLYRLRTGGIDGLSAADLAHLDQISAELRDRLHPVSEGPKSLG